MRETGHTDVQLPTLQHDAPSNLIGARNTEASQLGDRVLHAVGQSELLARRPPVLVLPVRTDMSAHGRTASPVAPMSTQLQEGPEGLQRGPQEIRVQVAGLSEMQQIPEEEIQQVVCRLGLQSSQKSSQE